MSLRYVAIGIALITCAASPAPATADDAVIYVDTVDCSDDGAGTQAKPLCTVQRAADIVEPAQRVVIKGRHDEQVTVSRSGSDDAPISFVGASWGAASVSGISFAGVHHANAANLGFNSIDISASSNIILSRITLTELTTADSTRVHLTKSQLHPGPNGGSGGGIRFSGGSSHQVTNSILAIPMSGITVSRTPGTIISNNTILYQCQQGLNVIGPSVGSVVANNIISGSTGIEYYTGTCGLHRRIAEVVVDEVAAADLQLDYNIVHGESGLSLYAWAGQSITDARSLYSLTGRGKNDINADPAVTTDGDTPRLLPTSPAVDSANSAAPGAGDADYFDSPRTTRIDNPVVPNTGAGPHTYHDRGATEQQDRFTVQKWKVAATRAPVGGTITVDADFRTSWSVDVTCMIDFGDGRIHTGACTTKHTYNRPGEYQIKSVATTATRLSAENVHTVTVVPAGGALELTLTTRARGGVSVDLTITGGSNPWNLTQVVIDWHNGHPPWTTSWTSVTYRYGKPGVFPIKVTATDAGGNTATAQTEFRTAGLDYVAHGPERLLDTRTTAKVPPRGTATVQVGRYGSIPADAVATSMNVTVTNATGSGFLTAYPNGEPLPLASTLNFVAGQTVPNLTIVPLGTDGRVAIYNGSDGAVDVVADVTGYFVRKPAHSYVELPGNRLWDSRVSPGSPLHAGTSKILHLNPQTPADRVIAAALNVTVTEPEGSGYITAYPAGTTRPLASSLNYVAGQTVANAVIAPVNANGDFEVYAHATSHVIVDVVGYFSSSTSDLRLVPVTPRRAVDTRIGLGQDRPATPLAAFSTNEFALATVIPGAHGAEAVVTNTTVTNPRSPGYLAIPFYPTGTTASTLNFSTGRTVPNLAIASTFTRNDYIGPAAFYNGSPNTIDLVVDVTGYFSES